MAEFIPGIRLAGDFYAEAVRPLLAEHAPLLPYAAALLGAGSEVAGFDTARSTDHDWGPRLQIFLSTADAAGQARDLTAMLARRLPDSFRGYPVAFSLSGEPADPARHHVRVADLGGWLTRQLGFDPSRQGVTVLDWLATPTQRLLEVTAGTVFHDEPGDLTRARARLAWYPRDVWLYILACQWRRIEQEEPFPGRCAEAGDDLGSAVVTARLARDLMRLCLLMHRRYPPYSKWLGSAFGRLRVPGLAASLTAALAAPDWPGREGGLVGAYEAVATMHNDLALTAPLDARTRQFYDRPYQVIEAARFTEALQEAIGDPQVRSLPVTGAVDQFVDSTDALTNPPFLRSVVRAALDSAAPTQPMS